ncbi:porin family protein [Pseudolabrys taiwanensis]|uniref:Porin family protein n=1 Tax=Pseudolabrys taiwanensis TaxID=331696 RepID=A0A346A250_9HYPH|nr:outer membrane protein [Pseudolabrys taiwanensis]AXK83247.1 porin family protein [Pseudolabrys taiwanensis]
MKKILLASIGVIALGVASASAADLSRAPMPMKGPAYMPPPLYNWTGLYVGINGGGGWGHSDFSGPFTSGSINPSGGLVGGTVGYNWQLPNQFVLGLEGDIDWSNIRGSSACGITSCETRNDWLSTVRGRIGYAGLWDRVMPYVTGGLALGNIKTNVAGLGSSDETKAGWTVGGGIEAAIAGPWTAKVEYLHVDLGSTSSVLGSNVNFKTDIVRAGLNYRF